jgi:cytidylate kinase
MSRSIEQMVDCQVSKWMAERRIADRASCPPPVDRRAADEEHRPVICISRECGARGALVGRLVAERLGFEFYAQEIVDEIAKHAHVRRKVVESLDERRRTGLSRWIDELVRIGRFRPSDYMRNLSEVVLTLGKHGSCVIVGRGAFFILDSRITLRVRCHAPLDWRVAQYAKSHDLAEAGARATVLRIDAEREDFYREHFKVDVRDPLHFDLLLNTAECDEKECASILAGAFEARFGPPKSQTRMRANPAGDSARARSASTA